MIPDRSLTLSAQAVETRGGHEHRVVDREPFVEVALKIAVAQPRPSAHARRPAELVLSVGHERIAVRTQFRQPLVARP